MKVLKFWREILLAFLAAACYYWYSQAAKPLPPAKVEYITKLQKEKEIVRVTEPGGRIVETVKIRENATEKLSESKPSPSAAKPQHRYSVGGHYNVQSKSWEIQVGRRLFDTPISVVAGVNPQERSVSVGARVDF